MEKARKKGTSRAKLEAWFGELERLRRWGGYLPEDIWNMDETGYAVGKGGREHCLVALESHEKDLIDQANKVATSGKQGQEWITTLDCISASGRELPPMVVVPGKDDPNPRDLPNAARDAHWMLETTHNGWTNNQLGLKWLKKIFLPRSQPSQPGRRRLLILDGHSSHTRSEFIFECVANQVDLIVLPPHSSHQTQPLDVGVFAAIKARLTYVTNHTHRFSSAETIPRRLWLDLLYDSRAHGFTKEKMALGFQKTGIEPLDPDVLLACRLPSPPAPPPAVVTPVQRSRSIADTVLSNLDPNTTPEKRREIEDGLEQLLQANASVNVMQYELGEYKKVSQARERAGSTVTYQNTHIFSQERVYNDIRAREVANEKKKASKKARDDAKRLKELQAARDSQDLPPHAGPSTIR